MDGVLLIKKEKGITSFGVVARVRKIFNIKKVGHTGTLDPETTGLLPILIGKATKISKYLIEHDKSYEATLKLGIKTDTGDSEGNLIEKDNFKLLKDKEKDYIEIIKSFIGKQTQIPPMYSAIKVKGKKLYEYAREGKEVNREEREIEIYNIKNIKLNYDENTISFNIDCSKGTYIRTLCEDIAKKIGTLGYMESLNRTKVDKFKLDDAVTLEELENNINDIDYINSKIISIDTIFNDKKIIHLDNRKKELFLNGVKLNYEIEDGVYRIYNDNQFIGLGIVNKEILKRDIVIIE